jgi:hypothetical protein
MEIFWVILVLQAFISGILASNLAEHKGHSGGAWFASGFFFGILGLIAAAGLPSKQTQQSASVLLKKCPDCAEVIKLEAKVCRFCRHAFTDDDINNQTELVEKTFQENKEAQLIQPSNIHWSLSHYYWECPNCHKTLNILQDCIDCKVVRPHVKDKKEGEWECQSCHAVNTNQVACTKCGQAKPSLSVDGWECKYCHQITPHQSRVCNSCNRYRSECEKKQ